ncbi:hypothetical protein [Pseudanabaena sp. UWO311]|uniref:hypothetical protein n=1 Tax=Pseudanabaena sp. UWO311 TaxID=2487337 RepID=UPI0030DBC5E7
MGIPSYSHFWDFATYPEKYVYLSLGQFDCIGGFRFSVVSEYICMAIAIFSEGVSF